MGKAGKLQNQGKKFPKANAIRDNPAVNICVVYCVPLMIPGCAITSETLCGSLFQPQ